LYQDSILYSSRLDSIELAVQSDRCVSHVTVDLDETLAKEIEDAYRTLLKEPECFHSECIQFLTEFFSRENVLSIFYEPEETELEQPSIQRKPQVNLPLFDEVIHIGDPLIDRKSVFVARCAKIDSSEKLDRFMQTILLEPKVNQATHNIMAFRYQRLVKDRYVTDEGYDDDGEKAAGSRLLYLLQLLKIENIVVVVSRHYGGIKLGPDRFKRILDSAKIALEKVRGC
jgi:hypothetical protein